MGRPIKYPTKAYKRALIALDKELEQIIDELKEATERNEIQALEARRKSLNDRRAFAKEVFELRQIEKTERDAERLEELIKANQNPAPVKPPAKPDAQDATSSVKPPTRKTSKPN